MNGAVKIITAGGLAALTMGMALDLLTSPAEARPYRGGHRHVYHARRGGVGLGLAAGALALGAAAAGAGTYGGYGGYGQPYGGYGDRRPYVGYPGYGYSGYGY